MRVPRGHLIYVRGAKNISISGMGTIDGNGDTFLGSTDPVHSPCHRLPRGWRPSQMLALIGCENVSIAISH
ncbi:MAG: hypothetical protein ACOCVH_02640 [Verrucomicrobiota bacterium]